MMRLKSGLLLASTSVMACAGFASSASAQSYLLGEIVKVPYTFCPRGFADASGQQLSIAQNSALFSLYGTTFGGNGVTTFALPDMRSRYSMSQGNGPGLSSRFVGEVGGTETTTLTEAQMPSHTHVALFRTVSSAADNQRAYRNLLATTQANKYVSSGTPTANPMALNTLFTQPTGGNAPFNRTPPTTTIRYCVALEGIFPSRN